MNGSFIGVDLFNMLYIKHLKRRYMFDHFVPFHIHTFTKRKSCKPQTVRVQDKFLGKHISYYNERKCPPKGFIKAKGTRRKALLSLLSKPKLKILTIEAFKKPEG